MFFPTKPATPASYSVNNAADKNLSLPEMTLLQGTVILLKNPHFLTLCVVHGLNVGLSIAWNGLMNQAISPYGYTDNQVGNIAAIGVVGGTLGCRMYPFFSLNFFSGFLKLTLLYLSQLYLGLSSIRQSSIQFC